MNYRLLFVPVSGRRDLQLPSLQNEDVEIPPAEWENAKLFRSCAIYDFDLEPIRSRGWDSLLGLTLAFGIGAGFWTAAGLLIARLW
jgi:hypothetical protein